jgi:hypothetical protein
MPKFKPPVDHYTHGMGEIQPIDFVESSFTPDEYRGCLKGNIIKYLSRYRYAGKPISDLNKALVYLTWLREFEETQEKKR